MQSGRWDGSWGGEGGGHGAAEQSIDTYWYVVGSRYIHIHTNHTYKLQAQPTGLYFSADDVEVHAEGRC